MKTSIDNILREKINDYIEICDYLFKNPELSGQEYNSSRYLKDFLQGRGFKISTPVKHLLPTAFVARFPQDAPADWPVFAFLAEYDALPGYGPQGAAAHACGHNWISASMCGCGDILSQFCNEKKFAVEVIGTPAEETFGAKYDMVEAGIFDNVSVAFQAHLNDINCCEPVSLAMNSVSFDFSGKAAHASQFPQHGINALDSVNLMFAGINAMRQHVRSDARIHGIITSGGQAANIVPDKASCSFSFRAKDKQYLKELRKRIINIAEGACLMTGASMEYHDCENPFDNIKNNKVLSDMALSELSEEGVGNFVSSAQYPPPGSSDIGNVSHVCPCLYVELAPECEDTLMIHDDSALDIVNSGASYITMEKCIKAFCRMVLQIAESDSLMKNIKNDFYIKG